ncbi:MAG: CRISPR-associated helicase Cas3' [Desulfobacterales bacterium]|nr:CRISPR-associated helicase Cas3' [Desulfobacterales bacterium]MDD4391487.1 CRISPR-associated helicase Cas3' [Desulfobacterales bacterium]
MDFYADGNKVQKLMTHIDGVRNNAFLFSKEFGCEAWGALLGDWHDLGKFMETFQRYMLEGGQRIEHAVVGGRYATDQFDDSLRKLALQLTITCHHTGLQNSEALKRRLVGATQLVRDAIKNTPSDLLDRKLPEWPEWLIPPNVSAEENKINEWKRSLEFWIRMLHSCLVDADWLDAEKRDPDTPKRPEFPSIEELRNKLDAYIDAKVSNAAKNNWTLVNAQRKSVLDACRESAIANTGFFSLTVPTGGGKTLSGMSFALNHAVENKMKRVIVVIPYTSIIEQNASVYAEVFGRENVIEHHSNLDPEKDTERNQLAAENWDAPVIVTTNVQFFESLYANKNSRLRKLHNISRSVIVLDEVQSLPPGLLYPILDAMRELREHYGCSIVLSTATQPALKKRKSFMRGLDEVKEIIPNVMKLSRDLARVNIEWETGNAVAYPDISERILKENMQRVLVVTHKRKDARVLAGLLPEETYHLSASMCPSHRKDILKKVTELLKNESSTVRLVSTQLIEAGVDIDFPVVFRALAGLDSISQTAGRCNREGNDVNGGRLIVFRAPTEPPAGVLRLGKGIMESLLNSSESDGVLRGDDGSLDLTSPAIYDTYFRLFYSGVQLDGAGVQNARASLDFPEVAKRFRMIDSATYPVVVPYKDAYNKLEIVRAKFKPSRDDFRSLQPFIVQIYSQEFQALNNVGALGSIHEKAFWYLSPPYERLYDERFGLDVSEGNLFPDYSKFNV